MEVQSVHQPTNRLHQPAASRIAHIPVPGPPGIPARWYLAALATGLGFVLLVLAVRLRFWEEIARWWRTRRPAGSPSGPRVVTAEPPLVAAAASGHGLRPDHVVGRVVDAHAGRAVARARVCLQPAEGDATVEQVGPRGQFAIGPLPDGAFVLRIEAPGYLGREARLVIPHDGSFDGATLALVSVRGRVRDVFATALARYRAAMRWGMDTPREAAHAASVDGARARAVVGELRELVEAAWFGHLPAGEDDARRAEELLHDLDTPT